jgi:hypothetical protein
MEARDLLSGLFCTRLEDMEIGSVKAFTFDDFALRTGVFDFDD